MNQSAPATADEPAQTPSTAPTPEPEATARADLRDAIGWVVLGVIVVLASLRMDRLEDQHINPLTVPGLVPGLLGVGMIIVGAIMGLRSVQRGALHEARAGRTAEQRERRLRVVTATLLCCGYSVVLIGRGLPFWLVSAAYVTGSILLFDRISSDPANRRISARTAGKALLIGILASVVVWLVFERLFLVRLP